MPPTRRTAHKRARSPSPPSLQDVTVNRRTSARLTPYNQHRVVENFTPRVEVSASPEPSHGAALSQPKPILSHDDAPPSHTCYLCRKRGGSYAFTCKFEEGSDTCTRCLKEGKRCREATTEEQTMLNARCPQCKSRGLTKCLDQDNRPWQKGGQVSCAACIKWKKVCGAPVQRNENALTRAFRQNTVVRSHQQEQSTLPVSKANDSGSGSRKRAGKNSAAMPKSKRSSRITKTKKSDPLPAVQIEQHGSIIEQNPGTPEDSAHESPFDTRFAESLDDDADADRQLILEADGAALPSPLSIETASITSTYAASAGRDAGTAYSRQPEQHQRRASVVRHRASRPRRTTANYEAIYTHLPLNVSEDDVSSYEVGDNDEDQEFHGAIEAEAEAISSDEMFSGQEGGNSEFLSDTETIPEPISKPKSKVAATSRSTRKGIDYSLPPMHDNETIFADLTSRALEVGLAEALLKLDRPMNIATMCSGTESPLFALLASAHALEEKKQPFIKFRHLFSAEIEQFKQAFIERNFAPEILFRDIREFIPKGAVNATTAYGSVKAIPRGVDILIAGFSCKNLSRQNNFQKSLKENGESGETWMAVYEYSRRFRPNVVLLENVKSKASTWDDLVSQWNEIGYEAGWVYCDTKRFYYPQTRERMYMIAIERTKPREDMIQAVKLWKQTMRQLERPCSSPYEAFLADFPRGNVDYNPLMSEAKWDLCQLRYYNMRSAMGLGTKRPCTKWSEDGSKQPLDFADHDWYDSRSSREWEAIEVAFLGVAIDGTDASFKEIIWDVSQNADRFHNNLGLVPCITPKGQVFATYLQQVLSGNELLGLQGLPLDKIHLSHENAADCQDLAGNAMSTTVIAASILSAIICSPGLLKKSPSLPRQIFERLSPTCNLLVGAEKMTEYSPKSIETLEIDIKRLVRHAQQSSKLCSREGDDKICDSVIQSCSACGHTACALHGGNPRHVYTDKINREFHLQSPLTFVNEWKPKLPCRITFKKFRGFSEAFQAQVAHDDLSRAFWDQVAEVDIESQQFCIAEFKRSIGQWKVLYKSGRADLELSIAEALEWRLYMRCPPQLPGDSALRKLLKRPIARGSVSDSLLSDKWEIFIPVVRTIPLRISGSSETYKSFRNTIGLLEFQDETVPARLHIRADTRNDVSCTEGPNALTGDYTHLPHCGTASKSLYKRASNPPLFFFLDPDPRSFGNDSFHFSYDCKRLRPGESRHSLARLNPLWRPWNLADTDNAHVNATSQGEWEYAAIDTTIMSSDTPSLNAKVLPSSASVNEYKDSCTKAVSVLCVDIPEVLPTTNIRDYIWALERVTSAPSFADWQSIGFSSATECPCAPAYPQILWHVDENGVATAYEDPRAAAIYERAIKSRCQIFHIEARSTQETTNITIALNISSLTHRAISNLAQTRRSSPTGPISVAWRLLTDQRGTTSMNFPKFRLRSNVSDKVYSGRLHFTHKLRGLQPRVLEWMRAQERGITFDLTEVEEANHKDLGWRVEARAQADTLVRGGVLADRPSFGKTVITIALIHSEFQQHQGSTPLKEAATAQKDHLVDTAATLVVCPPHLVDQWQGEFEKFLGVDEYKRYSIITVKTFAELQRLDMEDILHTRVVIVSWAILSDRQYVAHLAKFTAMPEPATRSSNKGVAYHRAFDAWMDRVNQEIPEQLRRQQRMSSADFSARTHNKLNAHLKESEFNMALPLQMGHGNQYKPFDHTQAAHSKQNKTPNISEKANPRQHWVPLLHFFRFNRIVVDEYHYLNVHQKDQKKAQENLLSSVGIKAIMAHKRWVLSGTPALGSFADVDNIASFLGVHLGRYTTGISTKAVKRTQIEKIQSDSQTIVEKFLANKETMSIHWHQARHQRAQEFLDTFVRQNEPSLEHIVCSESLRVTELSPAHRVRYLELSQRLSSYRMALKRAKNPGDIESISRLNVSLDGASTGEDALLKCALFFEANRNENDSDDESDLAILQRKRNQEYNETVAELNKLLRGFEGCRKANFKGLQKDKEASISQLYMNFRQYAGLHDCGDGEAAKKIHALLKAAERDSVGSADGFFIEGKNKDERIKSAKKALSKTWVCSSQLVSSTRSARFVSNIQSLLQPLRKQPSVIRQCDAPGCQGLRNIHDLHLSSSCGHLSCQHCLAARPDIEACVVPGCSTMVQPKSLIKVIHLGSQKPEPGRSFGEPGSGEPGRSFGRKVDSIAELIREIPDDDQSLLFAPDSRTISDLITLCNYHDISHVTPSNRDPGKAIQKFKKSTEVKVLILDLSSEAAAGVNLYNANHIIFAAPILAKTQYDYDTAMEQAIARSRRYGQEKKVHIYHFAALRTVDVDILEHRHKRKDGITDSSSSMLLPAVKLEKRERVTLVKNMDDRMALVPLSWLKNEALRERMGVDKDPESFTSLINFSEAFEKEAGD